MAGYDDLSKLPDEETIRARTNSNELENMKPC